MGRRGIVISKKGYRSMMMMLLFLAVFRHFSAKATRLSLFIEIAVLTGASPRELSVFFCPNFNSNTRKSECQQDKSN